jgi:hypothetical protein
MKKAVFRWLGIALTVVISTSTMAATGIFAAQNERGCCSSLTPFDGGYYE